jgi:acylphosphatase
LTPTTGAPRTVRCRVVVHGLVQGVWFRESCRRMASELGVTGWVRNRLDGTVEALFQGAEPAVARAVSWCRTGPPRADVTDIDVTEEPAGDDLDVAAGFRVR